MNDDEMTLRTLARAALQDGRLPNDRPLRIWGGSGDGTRCTLCERAIESAQTEFELQFSDEGVGAGNPRLHMWCFAAWEFERERSRAESANPETKGRRPTRKAPSTSKGRAGSSLPLQSDGGIIMDSEHGRTSTGGSE